MTNPLTELESLGMKLVGPLIADVIKPLAEKIAAGLEQFLQTGDKTVIQELQKGVNDLIGELENILGKVSGNSGNNTKS